MSFMKNSITVAPSSFEGLRVVRGPDWKWGNQDGDDGFLGTTKKLEPLCSEHVSYGNAAREGRKLWVSVVWDNGNTNTYRIGSGRAFDLRVVDSAAIGAFHDVQCAGCSAKCIKGFRWLCTDCKNVSVCSWCYLKHNQSHKFRRIETPGSEPFDVCRKVGANRLELKGVFPGALVKRPRDSDNDSSAEDSDAIGQVIERRNLAPGDICVEWAQNETSSHTIGPAEETRLRLYKHAVGGHYFPDDFPVLVSSEFDEAAVSHKLKFAPGDQVKVTADPHTLETLQDEEHGGWVDNMKQISGQVGTVIAVNEKSVCVDFPRVKAYLMNPLALERLAPYSIGQAVRVKTSVETIDSMCKFNLSGRMISRIVGDMGRVVRCIDDSEVLVKLDGIYRSAVVHQLRTDWIESMHVIERIRNDVEKLERSRRAVFLDAAASGELTALIHLVAEFGMNVDEQGGNGTTALHLACQQGQKLVVCWLVLYRGANIHLKDKDGLSAMHHAAKCGQNAVMELLMKQGARLDDKDIHGMTPLHLAVLCGCKRSVHLLVSNGCDVNAQDKKGNTALHSALFREARDDKTYRDHWIVDYLIDKCDLTITNAMNFNALLYAAYLPNKRAIELLMKKRDEKLNGNATSSESSGAEATRNVVHVPPAGNDDGSSKADSTSNDRPPEAADPSSLQPLCNIALVKGSHDTGAVGRRAHVDMSAVTSASSSIEAASKKRRRARKRKLGLNAKKNK